MPAIGTALAAVALLVVGLVFAGSAQTARRISDLAVNELHICRDGARVQLGLTQDFSPTVNITGAFQPPGSTTSALAPRTVTLQNRPIDFVPDDSTDPFLVSTDLTGTFTFAGPVQLTVGVPVRLSFGGNFGGTDLGGADGVDACLLPSISASSRMVGKGSITSGGQTAAYVYILNCTDTQNAGAPFEVRFNGQRFRMTTVDGVSCADYSNVVTPAAVSTPRPAARRGPSATRRRRSSGPRSTAASAAPMTASRSASGRRAPKSRRA